MMHCSLGARAGLFGTVENAMDYILYRDEWREWN